jgi:hypothetical protein
VIRFCAAVTVTVLVLVGCGGDRSELLELADETCVVLANPETTLADASLVLFESTSTALELGYTEEEFAEELRKACPASVIIGGEE